MSTRQITIQGGRYEIEVPYEAGQELILTAGQASQFNQVHAENVRNNMAGKRKKIKDEDFDQTKFAADVLEYSQKYEPGVGAVGVGRIADPVERLKRKMAGEAVKAALKAEGYKLKDVPAEKMNAFIDEYLRIQNADGTTKDEELEELAKSQLEATSSVSLKDILQPE